MKQRRGFGFTLWELMIVIALIVIFILAAIENLLPLRGAAEQAAQSTTAAALSSAVSLESMERVLTSGLGSLREMENANPVDWLRVPMANYAGVVPGGSYHDVPEGQWAFDESAGVVIYRVRYPEYFDGSFLQPPAIRYRVKLLHGAGGMPNGIRLEQLDSATWTVDGSELKRLMGDRNE